MAFALKCLFRQRRMKHRIPVNFREVVKILTNVAADRIDRVIIAGHGVDEGGHRPFHHLEERILHWILFAPTQDAMFEDVRNAGVVGWWSGEGDGEQILRIRRGVQMQKSSAGFSVYEFDGGATQIRQRYGSNNRKTVADL